MIEALEAIKQLKALESGSRIEGIATDGVRGWRKISGLRDDGRQMDSDGIVINGSEKVLNGMVLEMVSPSGQIIHLIRLHESEDKVTGEVEREISMYAINKYRQVEIIRYSSSEGGVKKSGGITGISTKGLETTLKRVKKLPNEIDMEATALRIVEKQQNGIFEVPELVDKA